MSPWAFEIRIRVGSWALHKKMKSSKRVVWGSFKCFLKQIGLSSFSNPPNGQFGDRSSSTYLFVAEPSKLSSPINKVDLNDSYTARLGDSPSCTRGRLLG